VSDVIAFSGTVNGAGAGGNGGFDHALDGDDLVRLGERGALDVGHVDDLGGAVRAAR